MCVYIYIAKKSGRVLLSFMKRFRCHYLYTSTCVCFVFQSCPVGRGPEFSRCVFDVHGHSPLVEQFLRMQKLSKDSGTSVLIQRTEIKSLPPYPLKHLALLSTFLTEITDL